MRIEALKSRAGDVVMLMLISRYPGSNLELLPLTGLTLFDEADLFGHGISMC